MAFNSYLDNLLYDDANKKFSLTPLKDVIEQLTLHFTQAQFLTNGSVVYPRGIRIYYVRSDGVVTPAYKLSDGVTPLGSLNFRVDKGYLDNETLVSTHRFYTVLGSNMFTSSNPQSTSNYNSNPWGFYLPMFVPYPVLVNRLSVNCASIVYTPSNNIRVLFYKLDPVTLVGTYVAGSDTTITVTTTDWANATTSFLLEPGLYCYMIVKPVSGGSSIFLGVSDRPALWNDTTNQFLVGANVGTTYDTPTPTTTIPNVLTTSVTARILLKIRTQLPF